MNIVFLTTEAVPFAKTGGLADVCGTLPSRIQMMGHQTAVIMPAFRSVYQCGLEIQPTDVSFAVPMSPHKLMGGRLLQGRMPDGDVPVWFIDQPQYFDRPSLYGTADGDYPDNAERFTFFCRAALIAISRMGWHVDIVHCNDWQTGLVPALINAEQHPDPWMRSVATVMTIHNLAYQGHFSAEEFRWTGLDWEHFNHREFEYYGHLNFLKTGIIASDAITTVSPRYAQEIRTPEHGRGLQGVLDGVADRLSGITNGIDRRIWDPATDPHLCAHYDIGDWRQGKWLNKESLQQEFGLEVNREVPMIGLVGRLAEQKGWDLILPVLHRHLSENRPTQWIVLGSGDPRIENDLQQLAEAYPHRFALHLGFSDGLAHRIEAGSDLFLMPSHYEPCGLNQLYSLRYGTVPVVTPTGGLADTVINCNETTLANQTATGFYLDQLTPYALDEAIGRALHLRYHEPAKWAQLIETGMAQDWSWTKSATEYEALYARTATLRERAR